MVVKMIKWRPWPSKKYEAKITLHQLRVSPPLEDSSRIFSVEIKWKGSKGIALGSLKRRSVRRNFTKEGLLGDDGVVQWGEQFHSVCSFSAYKDGLFHPWDVSFTLLNGVPVVGTASLNLADFASAVEKQDREISIPLAIPGGLVHTTASLYLSITLLELRNAEEPPELVMPRTILSFPRSPCYGEVSSSEKEEIKQSQRKVNIFEGLSAIRAKRTGHEEECSDGKSSDMEFDYPHETDSSSLDEVKNDDSCVRKPFNYGTLAYANHAGATIHSNTSSSEDEDWIYYSHRNSSVYDHPTEHQQNSKRRLLPWRKRKLSFRSPKVKGEPLLRKEYGEQGGDDIDFDRRQLSSSDESTSKQQTDGEDSVASESAFGDDNFAVGIWENKEIISRDGNMKLKTQVFFASIDQRCERAAGESACTALVAVIADWLQCSHDGVMPIKSQLDGLIREGSLEWRNLCENDTYRERFPDKHFDLETVLEAKVRPLSVVPEKSFIGFFQPEGLEDKGFDFLQGAMSFDNIWDEICRCASEIPSTSFDPLIYIISWNDHFFILKVEQDAYYIIDTLGERLYEGCNQAFIMKFDRDTVIHHIANESQKSNDKLAEHSETEGSTGNEVVDSNGDHAPGKNEEEAIIVCTGKESCKEYIKNFLAAIPIRELQVDLKKGLMASTPLHHRLQIEFHYTRCLQNLDEECSVTEVLDDDDIYQHQNLKNDKDG